LSVAVGLALAGLALLSDRRTVLAGRLHVLVQAEEVRRVVFLLELGEARVVVAEGGADGVGPFLAGEAAEKLLPSLCSTFT